MLYLTIFAPICFKYDVTNWRRHTLAFFEFDDGMWKWCYGDEQRWRIHAVL